MTDRLTTERLREIAEEDWPFTDERPGRLIPTRKTWNERQDAARELLEWREAVHTLMYIHRKKRLVWLANPKTASQSTADALVNQAGFERASRNHHDGLTKPADKGQYVVATTVRNHFDAVVSWWFHYNQQRPLDAEFIDHIYKSAYFPIFDQFWGLHAPASQVILKYERLDEDLNDWLHTHGLPTVELPHMGVSKPRRGMPAKLFIDKQTAKYIRDRFRDEMERYGYGRLLY